MSQHPQPGGPHLPHPAAGPVPADSPAVPSRHRSPVVWPIVALGAVLAVLGVAGVAIAAADPSWAIASCVVLAVIAVLAVLIVVRSVPAAVPETQPPAHGRHAVAQQPVYSRQVTAAPPTIFGESPGQRRDVFGKLAQRLQGLINRAIRAVDEQERSIEDPEQLKGLYEIDHLITRMRRQAENLAVLGGGALERRSKSPVDAFAVLRSAVAEIEHYKQVSIMPIEHVRVQGHAVAEVIHLLAELVENATTWTPPDAPKVVLRAHKVTAGLAVVVQDRGLGMTLPEQERINRLLDGSASIDLGELLRDGRIGLGVVKELARRHNIRVRLEDNIFGGIDAAVVLPHELLGAEDPAASTSVPEPADTPAVAAEGQGYPELTTTAAQAAWPQDEPQATERIAAPGPAPATHTSSDLPVRQPGTSFPPVAGPAPITATPAGDEPPPLPQRRAAGSHLRPELLEPPSRPTVVPGHDPNLIGAALSGFERGQEDTPSTDDSSPYPSPRQVSHNTEGGSAPWRTI